MASLDLSISKFTIPIFIKSILYPQKPFISCIICKYIMLLKFSVCHPLCVYGLYFCYTVQCPSEKWCNWVSCECETVDARGEWYCSFEPVYVLEDDEG